jgi:hypothetical protein
MLKVPFQIQLVSEGAKGVSELNKEKDAAQEGLVSCEASPTSSLLYVLLVTVFQSPWPPEHPGGLSKDCTAHRTNNDSDSRIRTNPMDQYRSFLDEHC